MTDSSAPQSVGVNTYARVRIFFKDRESLKRSVEVKTAEQTKGKGLLTVLSSEEDSVKALKTEFTDCFPGKVSNEYCYEKVCKGMIDNVLKGFKALLIAYGQTGSGKTFSLLGAKGPGELGLLPRTIQEFVNNESVLQIKMKAFEAYSTTLNKIPLYDLFNEANAFNFAPFKKPSDDPKANKKAEYAWVQKKSLAAKALWASKKGKTGFDTMKEGNERIIKDVEDGFRLVDEAHDASHFAKTGKNPESSRGHTVYILILKIKNPEGDDYDPVQTEFVVVDLAGSEGGSTLDALPAGPDKTARFLEGGVINFGLSSLKDMFGEMRKKGKLGSVQGNGLRKLLYPFVTSKTMISIVFTLSPSIDNIMPTRATMKFAQDACKLKTKPVAGKGRKNWKKAYDKLKQVLNEKTELLKQYEEAMKEARELVEEEPMMSNAMSNGQEVISKLEQAYEDHVEQLYYLFKEPKYNLASFLSAEILEVGENIFQANREDYVSKVKNLYKKHDIHPDQMPEEIVDMQLRAGVHLESWFEGFVHTFEDKIHHDKDGNRKVKFKNHDQPAAFGERTGNHRARFALDDDTIDNFDDSDSFLRLDSSDTLSLPMSSMPTPMAWDQRSPMSSLPIPMAWDQRRRRTTAFHQTAANLFEAANSHNKKQYQTMVNVLLDEFEDDSSDMDFENDSSDMLNDSEAPSMMFEELDGEAPDWFDDLPGEKLDKIQDMVNKHLHHGLLPIQFRNALINSYGLTEDQIDELVTYCLIAQGEAHDHDLIQLFHASHGKEITHTIRSDDWGNMHSMTVKAQQRIQMMLELDLGPSDTSQSDNSTSQKKEEINFVDKRFEKKLSEDYLECRYSWKMAKYDAKLFDDDSDHSECRNSLLKIPAKAKAPKPSFTANASPPTPISVMSSSSDSPPQSPASYVPSHRSSYADSPRSVQLDLEEAPSFRFVQGYSDKLQSLFTRADSSTPQSVNKSSHERKSSDCSVPSFLPDAGKEPEPPPRISVRLSVGEGVFQSAVLEHQMSDDKRLSDVKQTHHHHSLPDTDDLLLEASSMSTIFHLGYDIVAFLSDEEENAVE